MVEGTGLENQRRKRPQVRILSFPPNLFREVKSPVAIRAFLEFVCVRNLQRCYNF